MKLRSALVYIEGEEKDAPPANAAPAAEPATNNLKSVPHPTNASVPIGVGDVVYVCYVCSGSSEAKWRKAKAKVLRLSSDEALIEWKDGGKVQSVDLSCIDSIFSRASK